jgi:hypothetical protein
MSTYTKFPDFRLTLSYQPIESAEVLKQAAERLTPKGYIVFNATAPTLSLLNSLEFPRDLSASCGPELSTFIVRAGKAPEDVQHPIVSKSVVFVCIPLPLHICSQLT